MDYFKVWAQWKVFDEEPLQSRIVASFFYLSDAVDFAIRLSREDGVKCVLNGLSGGRFSEYEPSSIKV